MVCEGLGFSSPPWGSDWGWRRVGGGAGGVSGHSRMRQVLAVVAGLMQLHRASRHCGGVGELDVQRLVPGPKQLQLSGMVVTQQG